MEESSEKSFYWVIGYSYDVDWNYYIMRIEVDDNNPYLNLNGETVDDLIDSLGIETDVCYWSPNPRLAWEKLRGHNKDHWTSDGTPWDFNLAKITIHLEC